METTTQPKPKKRAAQLSKKEKELKKISQFGKAMLKYRGYVEIVDMEAVLK
ncbi:hypothetical protein [Petrimonas sp.]|uniref:hypothetical protein n=1 Tax=Petrimonas sp. TaxID=2023866 RepID=UPI003F51896A